MAISPDFSKMSVGDLRTIAETLDIDNAAKLKKNELIEAIQSVANADQTQSNNKTDNSLVVTETASNSTETSVDAADDSNEKKKRPRRPKTEVVAQSLISAALNDEAETSVISKPY